MAWLPEYRSLENPNVPLGDVSLIEAFGGQPTATGKTVNANTAFRNAAVYAAVNVIASAVGTIPLKVWQRDGTSKGEAREHPLWSTLHDAPNSEMTAQSYREATQGHMLTRGTGFSEIVRTGGGGLELWPISPDAMFQSTPPTRGATPVPQELIPKGVARHYPRTSQPPLETSSDPIPLVHL